MSLEEVRECHGDPPECLFVGEADGDLRATLRVRLAQRGQLIQRHRFIRRGGQTETLLAFQQVLDRRAGMQTKRLATVALQPQSLVASRIERQGDYRQSAWQPRVGNPHPVLIVPQKDVLVGEDFELLVPFLKPPRAFFAEQLAGLVVGECAQSLMKQVGGGLLAWTG